MYRTGTKKFYQHASIESERDGYAVLLDGKAVKTPAGLPLCVESKPLAEKLAEEWIEQSETIKPNTIPNLPAIKSNLMAFVETDMLCYRAEEPEDLTKRQFIAWQPLIDWAANTYDAPLVVTNGILPVPQPQKSIDALAGVMDNLNHGEITALSTVTPLAGSLVVGLALLAGRLDVDQAIAVIQLDEDYQNEKWGSVDEAQERQQNIRREIQSSAVFIELLNG
jgi:chaperone required for assembly of F1-ATPase